MKYRIVSLVGMLAAVLALAAPAPAAAQGGSCTPPANTINCQPAAVSLLRTDLLLGYQLAQAPHTRAPTVAQVLGLIQTSDITTALAYVPVQSVTLTGDITGTATGGPGLSIAGTLATVNASPGTYGDGTHTSQVTVDGKGRVTTAVSVPISVSGTVTTTGSPAGGNLTQFSGATSITNGNLSGDCATSGTLVVTCTKLNGVAFPATPSTNTVPVVTGSNTITYEAIPLAALATEAANTVVANVTAGSAAPTAASLPSCVDTAGNHLNYTNGTGFSCGTSSSGAGGTVTSASVVTANGFAGSVATATTTPAITLTTTVTGALKGNGTAMSQAACSDLSNGATGCSTATGTSGATLPLLNGTNVWSGQQSGSVTALTISTATFTPNGTNNDYSILLVHASCPCTLANPSATPVAGTHGVIYVTQSSTGSDTIGTWGSDYVAPGGTASITLSTAANAIDVLSYSVKDSTHIIISPIYNVTH